MDKTCWNAASRIWLEEALGGKGCGSLVSFWQSYDLFGLDLDADPHASKAYFRDRGRVCQVKRVSRVLPAKGSVSQMG